VRQDTVRINSTYRLKLDIWEGSEQANGEPLESPNVTIVRVRYPAGRKTAWFYDTKGNAFRAADFAEAVPVIAIED
jgi:hypothetical protein